MEPRSARIDRSGRLVLPVSIRRQLELHEGDEVIFTAGDALGEVRLVSRRAAVDQAQALVRRFIPPGRSLVDELLAERRRDVAREVGSSMGSEQQQP